MSREIKFKALYECKLHQVYDISLSDMMVTIPLNGFPYTHKVQPEKLIQFIGRNDIIGVEIYEGDFDADGNVVVWCENCNGWEFGALDIPTNEIFIHCHRCDGNFFFEDQISDFIVVGNICQNEFLKQENNV